MPLRDGQLGTVMDLTPYKLEIEAGICEWTASRVLAGESTAMDQDEPQSSLAAHLAEWLEDVEHDHGYDYDLDM